MDDLCNFLNNWKDTDCFLSSFPNRLWKGTEMNEVSVIACSGCSWQHFTLFWSPALVWCQTPLATGILPRTWGLRRVSWCHAVTSGQPPQLPSPLQATFIKTSNGAASSGTNIALCHHYFNNFEYFEYFNHWVTPWMPGLIFQIWWLLAF